MIVINPGSGPVSDATPEVAAENMRQLIIDAGVPTAEIKRAEDRDYGKGRFAFDVCLNVRATEVQMPGRPLEQVRYIDSATQNIWHFPRLYVDGSSWVWAFALSQVKDQLTGVREED